MYAVERPNPGLRVLQEIGQKFSDRDSIRVAAADLAPVSLPYQLVSQLFRVLVFL